MPFECKKYHGRCQAKCCGIVPIPMSIWARNQHNIQRDVKEKHKVMAGQNGEIAKPSILPITEDCYCPFLKKDLSCGIYNDRPPICKKFGDDSHILLSCPMQKADGTERTTEEQSEMLRDADWYIRNSN